MRTYNYKNYTHTQYLVIDIERRKNRENDWDNCSVAVCALDKKQDLIYPATEYPLINALDCESFLDESIGSENSPYSSLQSFRMAVYSEEEFVEKLFYSLNFYRQNNTQLVAFNLEHDENILKTMFHSSGYPFYYDDVIRNTSGLKGPFQHDGHDLMQIGIQYKASKLTKNISMRARLLETARALDIPVIETLHHSAQYDCWLAMMIFKKNQENLVKIFHEYAA